MTNNKETLNKILSDLPKTLGNIKDEFDTMGKSVLEEKIKDNNLVTREEFLEQQEKLDAIILKLNKLEKLINEKIN